MEVEVTTQEPRAGTVQAQVTDEVIQAVLTSLDATKDDKGHPKPGKVVAIGGVQKKEGTARTIVETVMKRLEDQDPPIYVRTHLRTVKTEAGEVTGYRGSVSLTPDGKPSRKKQNNNGAAAPAATPAPAGSDTPAKTNK